MRGKESGGQAGERRGIRIHKCGTQRRGKKRGASRFEESRGPT